MGAAQTAVDVRDMLCAQALAAVAAALARLAPGACLDVRYSQDDVKQDLLAWARAQGLRVQEPQPQHLAIARTPQAAP
jgi:TusA-related sulfurtransferase